MNTSINDLETKGFVAVPYPADLRRAVEAAVQSWKNFCALPPEIKRGLPYSDQLGSDGIGYELKDGVGPKADRKENFDITSSGQRWLEENSQNVGDQTALGFIRDAVSLVGLLKPLVVGFAREVEEQFDLPGFVEEVDSSEGAFFIRFIHYFGDRVVGEEIASAHADQSGFTPHLFESASGLQCRTFDGEWIDMPVSSGETVIIPSMQLQLRSACRLKALCHRVVATPETVEAGRYSAVCFVQLKNTPKYDKERHGRLQEKEPGFNYEMPIDQFKELFKA